MLNLRYCFQLAICVVFLSSSAQSVLADQRCSRYDQNDSKYNSIMSDLQYRFYNDEVSCEILDKFLGKLEAAARSDSPDEIADLFEYPFNWNIGDKKPFVIKSKAQFLKIYKEIFTPELRRIAIEGKVSEVGFRGFMIENGLIWFDPILGIRAINT